MRDACVFRFREWIWSYPSWLYRFWPSRVGLVPVGLLLFKVVGSFCWVVWFVGVRLWGIVLIFAILEF